MPGRPQVAGRKPSKCSICKKLFSCGASRRRHVIEQHENAGRYKCDYCERTFERKYNKEKHERQHTGERPFECNVCRKSFSCPTNLKSHYLNRHAEKKFPCPTCGKAFGRKTSLNLHLVCHAEERPFHCELCPYRFATKARLQGHHAASHAEKKLSCERCGKLFVWPSLLQKHLLHQHSVPATGQVSDQPRDKARPSQNNKDEEYRPKIVQSNGNNRPASAYNLRTKRKTPSYFDGYYFFEYHKNKTNKYQDDKPSEPDEATGDDDGLEEAEQDDSADDLETSGLQDDDQREEVVPDGRDVSLDTAYAHGGRTPHYRADRKDIAESDEDEQNDRPENDREAIPSIVLSSVEDAEDQQEEPKTSAMGSAKLKVVYDVEYTAPD